MKKNVMYYFLVLLCVSCSSKPEKIVKNDSTEHLIGTTLSKKYYVVKLEFSDKKEEVGIMNDVLFYEKILKTRGVKNTEVKNFRKRGVIISKGENEDNVLKNFVVDKNQINCASSYKESLRNNKIIEIPIDSISNCIIYQFCVEGNLVYQDDETGMFVVKRDY